MNIDVDPAHVNADDRQPETFVPTAQWQAVPPGAILPPGCDVELDFATGGQRARLHTPQPVADLATAVAFVDAWCAALPHVTLVAILPDGPTEGAVFAWPDQVDELMDWVERINRDRNVYFSVALADPRIVKKPRKSDIIGLVAAHADIDPRDGAPLAGERVRLLELADELANGMSPPTFVVDSGGGIQAFYQVAEPTPAEPEHVEAIEALNHRLEAALGGRGTWNADRIMRVPGTVNWPNAKKRKSGRGPSVARLLHESRRSYTRPELEAIVAAIEAGPPPSAAPIAAAPPHSRKSKGNGAAPAGDYPPLPEPADQDQIAELIARHPELGLIWLKDPRIPPPPDASQSGLDYHWCAVLARLGYGRDGIVSYLRAFRARHDDGTGKQDRLDYLWNTALKALESNQPSATSRGAPRFASEAELEAIRAAAQAEREAAPEPEGMPAELTHPPGLLGALVDAGARRSPYLTRVPALAGSLAGLATASSNRFVLHLGGDNFMPLNQYLGVIGATGSGKEVALDFAGKIAEAAGIRLQRFASDAALHGALAAERKDGSDPRIQLVVMDEFGRALQAIKGDHAGHQRQMLTLLMELRSRAQGGVLAKRRYSDSKNDKGEVRSPFINALFATTPRTLHDALTSADVVDGSLNRIVIFKLEKDTALRPLDQIETGRLDHALVALILRAGQPLLALTDEPGEGYLAGSMKTRLADFAGEHHTIDGQDFKVIEPEPGALAALIAYRDTASQRERADEELGSLWSRAFENAAKAAAVCALGEAIGTDPAADPGRLVLSERTARWATALVDHAISGMVGDLKVNLSSHEAERLRKLVMKAAIRLRQEALEQPNPSTEHTAPQAQQDQIRDLKLTGWFSSRDLTRRVCGKGRSSKDVKIEINGLCEDGLLAVDEVAWIISGFQIVARRYFYTVTPDGMAA